MKFTQEIHFHGLTLACEGHYFAEQKGDAWNPPRPAEFEIDTVTILEAPHADADSLLTHFAAWEEVEGLCLEAFKKEQP